MFDTNTEELYFKMICRLANIEQELQWEESWVEIINKYGLGYEVALSSGLTLESCDTLSDEHFIGRVSIGMFEWDI